MPSYGGTAGGKTLYISDSNFSFSPSLKCSLGLYVNCHWRFKACIEHKVDVSIQSTVVPATAVSSLINSVLQPHPRGEIIVLLMFLGETQPLASGMFH